MKINKELEFLLGEINKIRPDVYNLLIKFINNFPKDGKFSIEVKRQDGYTVLIKFLNSDEKVVITKKLRKWLLEENDPLKIRLIKECGEDFLQIMKSIIIPKTT